MIRHEYSHDELKTPKNNILKMSNNNISSRQKKKSAHWINYCTPIRESGHQMYIVAVMYSIQYIHNGSGIACARVRMCANAEPIV